MSYSRSFKSYQRIFEYLVDEEAKIEKYEKNGIISFVYCIGKMNFFVYLDMIDISELESMTQFLLDKFTKERNSNERIFFFVNFLLNEIMSNFPYLILNEIVLRSLMDTVDFAGCLFMFSFIVIRKVCHMFDDLHFRF